MRFLLTVPLSILPSLPEASVWEWTGLELPDPRHFAVEDPPSLQG